MNRSDILATARQAVTVDRNATHGRAENNFATIGAIWGTRLGVQITAAQVSIMLIDLKTVRAWGNPTHGDSWVDICGYGACGGEIATTTTTENLTFAQQQADRRAAGVIIHADGETE